MERPMPLIKREVYRSLKKKSREELSEWLNNYCVLSYLDGMRDTTAADMLALHDEFNFSTVRLNRVFTHRDETIEAIHKHLISADEIIDGLIQEGVKIEIK